MILPLTSEEKSRLKRLNDDKGTTFALKKLFINAFSEKPPELGVEFLAAQRIAFLMLNDIFHDLDNIRTDNSQKASEDNLV